MSDAGLIARYNYDEFVPAKVMSWLNFENSPDLGRPTPDFPLWYLDGSQVTLSAIWSAHTYTIVEFGGFT